jgi:hypothetical protein
MAKKTVTKTKIEIDQFKCVWGILCSLSSIDQQKNNVSLFNIIEQLNIPAAFFKEQQEKKEPLPVGIEFEVYLSLQRVLDIGISSEEIPSDIRIKVVDPTGKTIQESLSQIVFPKAMKRFRFRMNFNGISLTVPGQYCILVENKTPEKDQFKKLTEIPLDINKVA